MQAPHASHNSEINVTPFLDVLLVMLVIFMAALQVQRLLWTQTPPASTTECTGDCESIVLEVLPGGSFRLNRAEIRGGDLPVRLRAAFEGRPHSVLFVKGDPDVTYQDVVSALDVARGSGVEIVAIAPVGVR